MDYPIIHNYMAIIIHNWITCDFHCRLRPWSFMEAMEARDACRSGEWLGFQTIMVVVYGAHKYGRFMESHRKTYRNIIDHDDYWEISRNSIFQWNMEIFWNIWELEDVGICLGKLIFKWDLRTEPWHGNTTVTEKGMNTRPGKRLHNYGKIHHF